MDRTDGGGGGYGQHTAAVKDGLVAQEHDGRRAGPWATKTSAWTIFQLEIKGKLNVLGASGEDGLFGGSWEPGRRRAKLKCVMLV